jgi:hypothetical protein
VDQPGERVPAQFVGAEPVLAARALQPIGDLLRGRVVAGDQRRRDGGDDDQPEHDQPDQRRLVGGEAPEEDAGGHHRPGRCGDCGIGNGCDVGHSPLLCG